MLVLVTRLEADMAVMSLINIQITDTRLSYKYADSYQSKLI